MTFERIRRCASIGYLSQMAGEIKCFFFSEFDPVAGPKITCQVSSILYHCSVGRGTNAGIAELKHALTYLYACAVMPLNTTEDLPLYS